MNKSYFSIVAILFVLIFTSAQYNDSAEAVKGQLAPALTLENASNKFSLQAPHDHYVLVTFWSAANPVSRIENKNLARCVENNYNIKHVAINLDRSEALLKQLIIVDELDGNSQFFINNDKEKVNIMKQWNLSNDNLGSFLINDKGVIIDQNPSVETLAKL